MLIRFLLCCVLFLASTSNVNAAAFALYATQDDSSGIQPGVYSLVSKVTYHDKCPGMQVGDKSFSEMKISDYNGHLYANWRAKGWSSRNKKLEIKGNKMTWEFESKSINDKGAYVFVKTVNKVSFTDAQQIKITSYNKLYENGKAVCSYMLTTYGFAKK